MLPRFCATTQCQTLLYQFMYHATTQCQTMLCKRMSHQEGTRPTLSHAKIDLRRLLKNCFAALIREAGLIKWRRYYAGVRDGQEYETVILRKSGSCTNRVWTAQRSNRKSRPALCLSAGWNLGRFSCMTNVNGKHNAHCIPTTAILFVTTPVQLIFHNCLLHVKDSACEDVSFISCIHPVTTTFQIHMFSTLVIIYWYLRWKRMTMVWPETGWRNLVLPRHERTLENIGKVKVEEIIQTCSEAQRSIKITPGTKICRELPLHRCSGSFSWDFGIGVCLTWILYDFVPGFGCIGVCCFRFVRAGDISVILWSTLVCAYITNLCAPKSPNSLLYI